MTPELGHFALFLALGVAALQAFFGLAGAQRGRVEWMAMSRNLGVGQFAFVLVSFVALALAFIKNDFSLLYVAQNSNTALPFAYRIAAVWGAHEGSLLLWILILAGWTMAFALRTRDLPREYVSRVMGVLGLVSIGFMLFTLFTSNPFERLPVMPADGRDLNPILQDPALVLHPPMLYLGYVGLAIPFALACAALLDTGTTTQWARWARPWTTWAWLFLTLGISLGSWWAYYELGWGGWWFWDPVENASFMPWLVGTALMHSLAVTEQRKAFVSWTVLLAIAAFSLSLLGTFLVRSGVLVSVHAFASDPTRGIFILIFLLTVIGAAMSLYAARASSLPAGPGFKPWSRESMLLLNNVLLTVAAGAVLLGTLYPLFLDALDAGKISVGPPYFNAIFVPLMIPLLLFIGIGPLLRWKGDDWKRNLADLKIPLVASVVLTIALVAFAYGLGSVMAVAGIWLGCWAIFASLADPLRTLRQSGTGGLKRWSRARWGQMLAHVGMGITALGIAVVSSHGIERDVALAPGKSATVGNYTVHLERVELVQGPNYTAQAGQIRLREGDEDEGILLESQKRRYRVQESAMTEAGIQPRLHRDLYVALGEPLGGDAWSARVQVKPLVRFIWLGTLFMALGGVLAATDRRYRRKGPGNGSDEASA
ncbi:MAG: heme lyase CcmF/NrfE family subunit [Gammaproteobacteria bacterium]|nr:heme lyase CcmF/NrfE family subunit [Gammaproteobacteria bacterium]